MIKLDRVARRLIIVFMRFPRKEEGAAMVEFAIIAPLFLFLVFGTIQLMGVSHAYSILNYANYMALRAGSVHYDMVYAGVQSESLERIMGDAAHHAFGPMGRKIEGYPGPPSSDPNRAIASSPVEVRRSDVEVHAGVVNMGDDYNHALRHWLVSRTEARVRMGYPWVSRVLMALQLTDPSPADFDVQGQMRRGADPFSMESEPAGMASLDEMPWLILRSDAFLDNRQNSFLPGGGSMVQRHHAWPLSVTGGTAMGLNGGSVSFNPAHAHPAAFPIQTRFREGHFIAP